MTPKEFEDALRILRDEIYIATLSWHSYLTFNAQIGTDEALLDALNHHPSFWVITNNSLQHNSILTMGRIFDKNPRSHSIRSIIKACIDNPAIFSKEALSTRKDPEAPWFKEYIAKAFEPTAEHFKEIEAEVNACADIWITNYEPIRHKVIAHKDKLSKEAISELFSQTKIAEITDLLERLHTVEDALNELLWNARRIDLTRRKNARVQEAEEATKGTLASMLKGSK